MHQVNKDLRADLESAGYYPELVLDVLDVALADEPVVAHLVHPETTFDHREVRRHLTALLITPSRLVAAHVDDGNDTDGRPGAAATTESVSLGAIRSVALTHGVSEPARGRRGRRTEELTMAISWGAVQRVDLEPAACGDPNCEADHGLTGVVTPEDAVIRVSAQAEGEGALQQALDFARQLSSATAAAAVARR